MLSLLIGFRCLVRFVVSLTILLLSSSSLLVSVLLVVRHRSLMFSFLCLVIFVASLMLLLSLLMMSRCLVLSVLLIAVVVEQSALLAIIDSNRAVDVVAVRFVRCLPSNQSSISAMDSATMKNILKQRFAIDNYYII